jgi:glycosyltransferase involved in cell wall biosynthesis
MKLLLNGLPLLNPFVGVGVYTRRLIEGLERHAPDLNFQVLLPAEATAAIPLIPRHRLKLIQGPRLPLPTLLTKHLWGEILSRHAAALPQAIFHSPGPLLAHTLPPRTVVTIHDCIYRHFPRYLGNWGYRKHLMHRTEICAASAALVLTDSEFSRHDLALHTPIPEEKIRVLYPWVDEPFNPVHGRNESARVRRKLGLPDRFWLYLGGFDYRKNVEFLIRAYAQAHAEIPCPPLVLAGSIPTDLSKPVCHVHAALNESGLPLGSIPDSFGGFLLPGRIPDDDLPGLYAAADLFLYPSLYEGYGLPPAEAIHVGTPALVSNTTSLPEVVPDPAFRFDPTLPQSLVPLLMQHARLRPERIQATHLSSEKESIADYLELLRPLSV